jgi:hypothetical protein
MVCYMLFESAKMSRNCSLWQAESQRDSLCHGLAHSGRQRVRQTGSQTPTGSRGHADSCNSNNLLTCRSASMATAPLGRAACCRATFAMGYFCFFQWVAIALRWVTIVSCDGLLLLLSILRWSSIASCLNFL